MKLVPVKCPYCGNEFKVDTHNIQLVYVDSTPAVIECDTTEGNLPFGQACGKMFAVRIRWVPKVTTYTVEEAVAPANRHRLDLVPIRAKFREIAKQYLKETEDEYE